MGVGGGRDTLSPREDDLALMSAVPEERLPPKVLSRLSSWFNFYFSPCGNEQDRVSAWGLGQQSRAKRLFQRSSAQPNGRSCPASVPSKCPGFSSLLSAPGTSGSHPPSQSGLWTSPSRMIPEAWLGPSDVGTHSLCFGVNLGPWGSDSLRSEGQQGWFSRWDRMHFQ